MGESWALRAVMAGCALVLVVAFVRRDRSELVARAGLGYALGIVGLGQMTLLLLYSLRKRLRWLRGVGAITRWFEVHMMLGLLGPTAVLLHCNFRLGSLNSRVALFSTLLVAGSGIAGRFLYARIHHGLLGARRTLAELRGELRDARGVLARSVALVPGLAERLDHFEAFALQPTGSAVSSIWRFLSLGPRTLALRFGVRRAMAGRTEKLGRDERGALTRALDGYLDSVGRTAVLGAYEWLFGLWHAVHLPLCFVLFGSAAAHIVAVHVF